MAVCISLMFGRSGGVVGSFVTASLLDNHCELAFYLSASTVSGECAIFYHLQKKLAFQKNWQIYFFFAIRTACGFAAYFVKNIHDKAPRPSIKIEPRLSIMSSRGWTNSPQRKLPFVLNFCFKKISDFLYQFWVRRIKCTIKSKNVPCVEIVSFKFCYLKRCRLSLVAH